MTNLLQYLQILSAVLSLLFVLSVIQGCSLYAGFHVGHETGTRTTQSGTPNERETVKTVSDQNPGNVVR